MLLSYISGLHVVFFNKPATVNFSNVTTPFNIKFKIITIRISHLLSLAVHIKYFAVLLISFAIKLLTFTSFIVQLLI
jgi:hypothetical protein